MATIIYFSEKQSMRVNKQRQKRSRRFGACKIRRPFLQAAFAAFALAQIAQRRGHLFFPLCSKHFSIEICALILGLTDDSKKKYNLS